MSRRDPQFNVRIPSELKDKLVTLAERNKRSINTEIVAAIEAAVELADQGLSIKRPEMSDLDYSDLVKRIERLEKKSNSN
ncbi:Arc family DNA-binding protein [Budviciaceae bacterium BWR-B9]|uniref:Arc family DNA-binding protein n=1 Tax=Limnobaculum allomyrinae TaxID=2791986 RepID=A0ABS1IW61_9GAMM|nr:MULTISPECIES: Arc family DNA-binding protein [Limnobaculum]MBK5146000.1 Arc family DNA-binding protein [Limnobaculum allomyrinae]MBV7694029.1 Arc family DNA-binding protein [Limnobaculum sp. M2-1]